MFGMGHWEILIILVLVLILFGAKRLPELAHSLGKSIKEFKHATQDLKDEFDLDKIEEKPRASNAQQNQQKETQKKSSQS